MLKITEFNITINKNRLIDIEDIIDYYFSKNEMIADNGNWYTFDFEYDTETNKKIGVKLTEWSGCDKEKSISLDKSSYEYFMKKYNKSLES